MSSQMAHPRGCIVIVIAFIWLSSAVCFDSQIRCKFSLIWINWGLRSPLGHLTLAHVGSAIRSGPPAKENYFGVGRRTWTPDRPFRCLNFHFLHLLFVLFSRCYTTFSYSFRYPCFPVYMIFLPYTADIWYLSSRPGIRLVWTENLFQLPCQSRSRQCYYINTRS